MSVATVIQNSIARVGIKEVARRTGLSPSTISRVRSGLIRPTLEVVEKIADAVGVRIEAIVDNRMVPAPRLEYAKNVLGRLRNELKIFGVKHAVVYGSVAREEDTESSDIDIFLDFGDKKVSAADILKAEGKVIEGFGENKVDIVSKLGLSAKEKALKSNIEKEGVGVF
jgi:predicted nucleotidyltransferase